MKPFMSSTALVVALVVLSAVGIIQVAGIALAQAPEKGNQPAPRPAQAPRAATPAPRAVARPPTARAPAQRPMTVQPSRQQRPTVVQRPPQQRVIKQGNAPARVQQQVQQPRQERRIQPGVQPSAPKQVEKSLGRPDIAGKRGQQGVLPIARVQVTDQQRRQVHRSLARDGRAQRISRSQLDVPLAIGSRIPRRHHLYRFTPALLALAPMYAAYSYIMVDDTICVVDPDTYAIVDMIPPSIEEAGPPFSQGALALSGEQMRCVYANAPNDRARTDLRIRLALGAEIPRSVELFPFPDEALACAPELTNYAYIVVQDDLVIVNPADYAIVQVISD
jgi:Protein of unknown function (DUF1236)